MGARAVTIWIGGAPLACRAGRTVASALLDAGYYHFRDSPSAGAPRGPFCMIGACQECAIFIDGRLRQACQTAVADGMRVELRGAP